MMSDFMNPEETPETVTDEIVRLMNELNLDVINIFVGDIQVCTYLSKMV